MITDRELLDKVLSAKNRFGEPCSKYSGAMTVEMFKAALEDHGIAASPRDVFIKGLPIEIDLVIAKPRVMPDYGLIYRARDVVVALEIKLAGSFGENGLHYIKHCFEEIKKVNPEIHCLYLTLMERKSYRWAVSEKNLGYPAYTLFWHSSSEKNRTYESTGDWNKLTDHLKRIINRQKG